MNQHSLRPIMRPLTTDSTAFSTASVRTEAVGGQISVVRVVATEDCYIDHDGTVYPYATSGDGTDEATWQASTTYALGAVVVGTATSDIYFMCEVAGDSDSGEPTWNTDVGDTTVDNEVTWRTYALEPTMRLEQNREEFIRVTPGEKLAVISDGTDGTLYMTRMSY